MAPSNHKGARKSNTALFPGRGNHRSNWHIIGEIIITIAMKLAYHKMSLCHLCIVHGLSPKDLTWPVNNLLLDLFLIASAFDSWLIYIVRAVTLLKLKESSMSKLWKRAGLATASPGLVSTFLLGCNFYFVFLMTLFSAIVFWINDSPNLVAFLRP